jgi:hypothetical protein
MLFKFVADPPTATTQRLSGIAGGSLPAFIEAADNFAGQMSFADNIIYQFLNHVSFQNFHLMGDDTWIHLFPYIIDKTKGKVRGYHSFDLFDLNTVDDGIKEQLFPTLEINQHDVIIAHFLGLDHCGHKFGPLHPECGKKLREMDTVIRDIIKTIDDDSLLIVMGDHGMTEEGDHGGNSPKEISSAIFFYSKNKKDTSIHEEYSSQKIWDDFYESVRSIRRDEKMTEKFYSEDFDDSLLSGTIPQIDLPATISLFFGLPIPFGNIGSMIPEVFRLLSISNKDHIYWLLEAVRLNAYQMIRYFESLVNDEGFSNDKLAWLRQNIMKIDEQAAKLPPSDMDTEITLHYFLEYYKILNHGMIYCRSVWACFNYKYIFGGLILSLFGLLLLFTSLLLGKSRSEKTWIDFMCYSLLLFVQIFGKATNSFIIQEDSICYFMFMSCMIIPIFFSSHCAVSIIYMLIFRLFMISQSCREEQGNMCIPTHHRSIKILSLTGLLGLTIWSSSLHVILSKCLYDSRNEKIQAFTTALFYFASSAYHLVRWIHENFSVNEWCIQIFLPRILFAFAFFGFALSFILKDGKILMVALSIFLSSILRPFGGFILLNIGFSFLLWRPKLSDSIFSKSLSYYILGILLFFMSGHQATLTSIQWEAAYSGFKELNQLRAFIFLILNTFSGQILAFSFLIVNDLECAPYFLLISALELVFHSFFVSLFLRHLMLWKVFTPRFLLQVASVSIYFVMYVLVKILKAF